MYNESTSYGDITIIKSLLIILTFFISSVCNADLLRVDGKASDYATKLNIVVQSINASNKIQNWYKADFLKAVNVLKGSPTAADFAEIATSIGMSFPAFGGEQLKCLRKIVTFCIGQVLLQEIKDKVRYMQSSFVPTEDELECVTSEDGSTMSVKDLCKFNTPF